jgi:hypothetical protein
MCEKHGTTTCSVLRGLIKVTVAGEKQGIVTIPSQNPITIQLNHIVLGAPRGRYSHVDLDKQLQALKQGEFAGEDLTAAVQCDALQHRRDVAGCLGFCLKRKCWTTPEICSGCVHKDKPWHLYDGVSYGSPASRNY